MLGSDNDANLLVYLLVSKRIETRILCNNNTLKSNCDASPGTIYLFDTIQLRVVTPSGCSSRGLLCRL